MSTELLNVLVTVGLKFSPGWRGDEQVSGLQLAPVSFSFRNRLEKRTTVSASMTLRPVSHKEFPHHVSRSVYCVRYHNASPHSRFIDLSLSMPTRDMCVRPIRLFQCLIKIEGAPCLPDSYYDAGFRSEKSTWLSFDENMTARDVSD